MSSIKNNFSEFYNKLLPYLGGGGSDSSGSVISLLSKAEWDAMSIDERIDYSDDLIAVYTPAGNVTMYYPKIMPKTNLPFSNAAKILCDASADIFTFGESTWGLGDSPLTFEMMDGSDFTPYVYKSDDPSENCVLIKNETSGNKLRSYCELGDDKCCTAYIIGKMDQTSQDIPSIMGVWDGVSDTSSNMSAIWCGGSYTTNCVIATWSSQTAGDAPWFTPSVYANNWFAFAYSVDGVTHKSKAFGSNAGSLTFGSATKTHGSTGQRIGLGQITGYTVAGSTRCMSDLRVKYFGLVSEVETAEVMQNNLTSLINKFMLSE